MKRKDKVWFKMLDKIVDDIWLEVGRRDLNNSDLARATGLSYNTIMNLDNRVTRYPQLRTVVMLARGMGVRLSLDFRSEVAKRGHASSYSYT